MSVCPIHKTKLVDDPLPYCQRCEDEECKVCIEGLVVTYDTPTGRPTTKICSECGGTGWRT